VPTIRIVTIFFAPVERCFDLSRSIELHVSSTARTGEKAVAGVTHGLMGMGEEVTWRATHFGVRQNFTSRISGFDRPRYFRDEMVRGAFARFGHDHHFEECQIDGEGIGTKMTDVLEFASPLGPLGALVDWAVMTRYLTRFLRERNVLIMRAAESDAWKQFL
jgi:ligand-binding SRPBCC domain-containing protein